MQFNVLIVDDSAVMRSMILKTLKLSGLPIGEVHQAANGAEGLTKLREHWIDLALIDINMPVMNGEAMLEAMRADPELERVPVIVVSTEGSETRIERFRDNGAQFVHKPFTPEQLRTVVLHETGVPMEQAHAFSAPAGDDLDF